jgi:hypothetical protein
VSSYPSPSKTYSRAAPAFRQSDVTRAVRAAGDEISRVEITKDGNITVICGKAQTPEAVSDPFTQWERQHEQAKATRRGDRN